MKKLAIFVEGYTELIFVDSLIHEIAGANRVVVEQRQIRGGATVSRSSIVLNAAKQATAEKYYVLVVDCGGDKLVKTRIQEEHQNLSSNSFEKIIGLRDVRPDFEMADIPRLESGLRMYIKTSLIPVEFILSIMELEAWFLAEHTHFNRVDPAITVPAIQTTLGFNPEFDDMSQRLNPSDDLNNCYAIGGRTYSKSGASKSGAASTIASLDFAHIYLELPKKIPQIKRLVDSLDTFLS